MSDSQPIRISKTGDSDPWLLWIFFFSSLLIFTSLWIISDPIWHLAISGLTLVILWRGSPTPLRTLRYIVSLVGFLAILQILFSSFMRNMFLRSLNEGFAWSDWQYLLFAVGRLAWPLAIVATFQSKLTDPAVISHLTKLLSPFKWLGLKIEKLQMLILLTLKFMPSLKTEWERFSHFQTYFVARLPRKTLIQKLSFWQGVFKAMVSHTIHRSVTTGDMLALRGLPGPRPLVAGRNLITASLIWLPMGGLLLMVDTLLFYLWVGLTIWMGLVALSTTDQEVL
ncbi:MAG: hypothetical protein U9Q77_05650 [Candidatus Marinimicrobia bacterium]|nr:hypothetical protein [Candidatus Neomarinimicrobiota bacterium]